GHLIYGHLIRKRSDEMQPMLRSPVIRLQRFRRSAAVPSLHLSLHLLEILRLHFGTVVGNSRAVHPYVDLQFGFESLVALNRILAHLSEELLRRHALKRKGVEILSQECVELVAARLLFE